MANHPKGAESPKRGAALSFDQIARTTTPVSDPRPPRKDRVTLFFNSDVDHDPQVSCFREFLRENTWVLYSHVTRDGLPYLMPVDQQCLYDAHQEVLSGEIKDLKLMRLVSYETRPYRDMPPEVLPEQLRTDLALNPSHRETRGTIVHLEEFKPNAFVYLTPPPNGYYPI